MYKEYTQNNTHATNTTEHCKTTATGTPEAVFLDPKSAKRFGSLLNNSHLNTITPESTYHEEIENEFALLLTTHRQKTTNPKQRNVKAPNLMSEERHE